MNTVLDDNKVLCLTNGQKIKLNNQSTMMFEVEDLVSASPATVSRCGMILMETDSINWRTFIQKKLNFEFSSLENYFKTIRFNLEWLLSSIFAFI